MPDRILLVDDYEGIRTAIRSLLTSHAMEVCGEAEDGEKAVEKVRELKPDIVLLDINMPVMNGIEAAYEIHRIAPSTKILLFTIHDSPEVIAVARLIGAAGLVPKSTAGTELIPAVKRLLQV